MSRRSIIRSLAAVILASCVAAARADSPNAAASAKKRLTFAQYVHAQINSALDTLEKDTNYPAAEQSLLNLFDQTVIYSPSDQPESIREADFALRLVAQLEKVPASHRDELLPFLRKHDNLAHTVAFLIKPTREGPVGVYELLNKLREKREDKLDKYDTLAAAVCVVQNRTRSIDANENKATSTDPISIFDYYVKNEGRMYFGVQNVPAELLIYVVDTTASIHEMEWALKKYAGTAEVGKLFFSIKYDYDYLKNGGEKKLTKEGFNLENIAKFGGVCIDQAYFATTVGKAIGVPTSMDLGSSGEAGHAWVGFLQLSGHTAQWNFNDGRYQSYQGVEGSVQDPQTRQRIPDCYVSLLGEMIGGKAVDRQNTVALTDAAHRLADLEKDANEVPRPDENSIASSTMIAKFRPRDTTAQLAMIDAALHDSVAYTPAWFTVRDLAVAKKLSITQKHYWSDQLLRLGAKKYPDFTLSALLPMVQSIDDALEQDTLLNMMLPMFATRMDLSASIRMAQASLWESKNESDRAGRCYMEVVERYCNDGPFVLGALAGAEKMLLATHRDKQVTTLYEQAWGRTKKPVNFAPEFVAESNWFRIGKLYEQKLKEAGETGRADQVAATLKGSPTAAAKGS